MGEDTIMRLTRLPGWEVRLADYLKRVNSRTFDRGMFDCVRFTADAVYEIVGLDLADRFRHKYKTDEEAKQLVDTMGPDGFHKVIDEVALEAGFVRTDWKHAFRGDPVFIQSTTDEWAGGLGVCVGAFALTPTKQGLRQASMRLVRTVWSIPYV